MKGSGYRPQRRPHGLLRCTSVSVSVCVCVCVCVCARAGCGRGGVLLGEQGLSPGVPRG